MNGQTQYTVAMTQPDLPTSKLDYDLPPELIATRPAEPRDSARLLVVHPGGEGIEHRCVRDLPEYLKSGDVMVFNNTMVLPARFIGRRVDTAGRVEGLFLHTDQATPGHCEMMLKSNGRLRVGLHVELLDRKEQPSGHIFSLIEKLDEPLGAWIVQSESPGNPQDWLHEVGITPLPPYIQRARGDQSVDDEADRRWYQTVYAKTAERESVAAPTAGLHFTPELLQEIDAIGVNRQEVTLHVGAGTFQPITVENLREHHMHEEFFHIDGAVIDALRGSSRVIAVGTTSVRALESLPAQRHPSIAAQSYEGVTDLFIAPPYDFKNVDGMLTNFHLPRSSLLALVGAMVGLERLLEIYRVAVEEQYRFYSYGDAMLILPDK